MEKRDDWRDNALTKVASLGGIGFKLLPNKALKIMVYNEYFHGKTCIEDLPEPVMTIELSRAQRTTTTSYLKQFLMFDGEVCEDLFYDLMDDMEKKLVFKGDVKSLPHRDGQVGKDEVYLSYGLVNACAIIKEKIDFSEMDIKNE